ncbi:hypothetical protein [Crateriforma spongiae]|uniref:hypothetical protein n=1 Tax=Crateriforma spongiae TaxID=2724528 RepID=UPI001447DC53|nr:hypothetical protein [Crateriforma spongiae]
MTKIDPIDDESMTLDPPGTIVVLGAGPTGIEAALYGRFLGYDVTLGDSQGIAGLWQSSIDDELPVAPEQCLSPLAKSALRAQRSEELDITLPTTASAWIDDFLTALTETDLLRDRLVISAVESIDQVPVEPDPEEEPVSEDSEIVDADQLPPDFLVTFADGTTKKCEAVIVTPDAGELPIKFALPTEYWFAIDSGDQASAGDALLAQRRRIVQIFAILAGRGDLDLYRPVRL